MVLSVYHKIAFRMVLRAKFVAVPEEVEIRVMGLVILFLQLGCYFGMLVILAVNKDKKTPDERWPRSVSHLERLYALFFFIMLLLIPEGTLVN